MASENRRTPRQAHQPRHAAGKPAAAPSRFPVLAGILAVSLMFACAVALFVILIRFGGIPTTWLIVSGAVLAVLTVLFAAGCDARKTSLRVTCFVLSLLFSVILLIGAIFVNKAVSTLNDIYEEDTSVTYQISVIVRAEDDAEEILDVQGYPCGILGSIDRANTDKAISMLYEQFGLSLSTVESPSVPALISGLLSGETDAILLNDGYRSLASEVSPDFAAETRVLYTCSLQDETKPADDKADAPDKDPDKDPDAGSESEAAPQGMEPFIVFLTGIDTFGSEETVSRSDVNILATVNPETKEVLLVTTPRDSYVELPTAYYNMDKLTHAALYGGVESSMETLENLYDIEIDYYVRVNFTGFETIVDSIGGIDVYSEVAFTQRDEYYTDLYYEQGWNHLNGYEALYFVRSRNFPDGDFQRGRNQMAAIEGILDKVMSPAILTSYLSLMDSIAGTFSTNFPDEKIAELVKMQLNDGAEWNITSYEVAGWPDSAVCYSMGEEVSIVYLESSSVDEVKNMISAVMNGMRLG